MIPTLFGVTLVTFLVMTLAPGDPIKSSGGGDMSRGAEAAARQNYLLRKREFALDKPLLLNFEWFGDYRSELESAAWIATATDEEIGAELASMAASADSFGYKRLGIYPSDWTDRQQFIAGLGVYDFARDLTRETARPRLVSTVRQYSGVWAEDLGAVGVQQAADLLTKHEEDDRLRRGLLKSLRSMAPVDLTKTLSSGQPSSGEIENVLATWTSWWTREKDSFAPLSDERRAELNEQFAAMLDAPTREEMQFYALDELFVSYEDMPFFYEKLAEEGASTRQIDAASSVLSMNVQEPMLMDVPKDASEEMVDRVAQNWTTYVATRSETYDPGWLMRLAYVPADTQYARMAWRLITFQFGETMTPTREDVGTKLWDAFLVSAPIMLLAQLVIYLITIPLGVACGANRDSLFDRLTAFVLFFLYSVPPAVAAMLALLAFAFRNSYRDGTLRAVGFEGGPLFPMEKLHSAGVEEMSFATWTLDYLWHAALPVGCLSLFSLAMMAMYSRASILDVLNQDYVRTARAKGASPRRVLWKHAFRNALIPVLTLFANFLPALLGGSVLIEVIFNIPGLGRAGFEAIQLKDYPTVMALIYIDAIVVMFSILLTDVLYVFADPRITFESRRT